MGGGRRGRVAYRVCGRETGRGIEMELGNDGFGVFVWLGGCGGVNGVSVVRREEVGDRR